MNPFKKRATRPTNSGGVALDTCGLIDGRIISIAKAGFLPNRIVIPQFVIAELQFLADHGDTQKRERARFGLDVIRELQDVKRVEVVIAREQFKNIKEVDDKLVALAKQTGVALYTTDYNLNKVAQIEGVKVLNVNELAQALRPPRLPGEQVELKITQVGQDRTQGVSFLDDGTMVVVEKAGNLVGQRVKVQFSRILQTQAGKMMFAVLLSDHKPLPEPPRPVQQHTPHVPQVAHYQPKPIQQPAPKPQQVYHAARPAHPPKPHHQNNQQPQPPQQTQQRPPRKPANFQSRKPQQQAPTAKPVQQRAQPRRRQDIEDSLLNAIRDQQ